MASAETRIKDNHVIVRIRRGTGVPLLLNAAHGDVETMVPSGLVTKQSTRNIVRRASEVALCTRHTRHCTTWRYPVRS